MQFWLAPYKVDDKTKLLSGNPVKPFCFAGIGVGLTRDPATLMLGQYFKRRRAAVEVVLVAGSGVGLALMSIFIQVGIR